MATKNNSVKYTYIHSETAQPLAEIYAPQSTRLLYKDTAIEYDDGFKKHRFDLADYFLPPTNGHPKTTRLSDEPSYINTALACADLRIQRARGKPPTPRAITRQLTVLRHVLDWLRSKGIYRLADASKKDIDQLIEAISHGGWSYALSLEARWHAAIDQLAEHELYEAFHFRWREGGETSIEAIMQPFWQPRIGWGGLIMLPHSARLRLDALTQEFKKASAWINREQYNSAPPTQNVLRNIFGWLNDLAHISPDVDHFKFLAVDSAQKSSRKLAKKEATRTSNLSVNDAFILISKAYFCLYEIAPVLIGILEKAQEEYPLLSMNKRRKWLCQSDLVVTLSAIVKKPIDSWSSCQSRPKCNESLTIDDVLSAVQGACSIIIAAMNARRQREICDRNYGLRLEDLKVIDADLRLYQANFYIEKTYQDRHLFYVNQTTVEAIECLERIKKASYSLDKTKTEDCLSLFSCGRWAAASGPVTNSHFSFSNDEGRTRSLTTFFEVTGIQEETAASVHAHMFRRFYSILYYYGYDHPEIRALRQHLRHRDIGATKVYVIDPSSRPLAEQIRSKINANSVDRVNQQKLSKALLDEFTELEGDLSAVEKEKLDHTVLQILNGDPTAGGFSRLVRKLYRQMLVNVEFSNLGESQQAKQISQSLYRRGYQVVPMSHGQCHAPEQRRHLHGACFEDGLLHKEKASARLCGNCPFHFNNDNYLLNLKEDLEVLDADRHDYRLPPLQQARAHSDYGNLKRLIELTELTFRANQACIAKTKPTNKNDTK